MQTVLDEHRVENTVGIDVKSPYKYPGDRLTSTAVREPEKMGVCHPN